MYFSGYLDINIEMMLRKDIVSVSLATFYLFIHWELLQFENTKDYATVIFLFSAFVILWMVFSVVKRGKYIGHELDDEEFGYQDKEKDKLGIF